MLKENGYQESIINKILKKLLTITALLVKMRNLSNRYSEGLHQNKFKFHVCCRFLWKNNISNQITQKYDHLLKTLCVKIFVNQNIEQLQKIKVTLSMKLTVITDMQYNLVDLNGPEHYIQMKLNDLPRIVTVKRLKLRNTRRKQIITIAGVRRKLLIKKSGYVLGRSNKLYIL